MVFHNIRQYHPAISFQDVIIIADAVYCFLEGIIKFKDLPHDRSLSLYQGSINPITELIIELSSQLIFCVDSYMGQDPFIIV